MKRATVAALALSGAAATAGGVYGVVRLAAREHADPARCGPGFNASFARCCAPGQTAKNGHCAGEPLGCPPGTHLSGAREGCVVDARRVAFRGGKLALGLEDWQADGVVTPRTVDVPPFALDASEVTAERWEHCTVAGACRKLDANEPGAPVTNVDPREAERFCRFEKGRLPTGDEWLFAAMGPDGRRFPWGPTGLVCRRAAFGLVDGPCAHGGGPELAGTRPTGATPDGVLDLAGNVAEWTLEPGGRYVARGGSYRSRTALELKSWASETVPQRAPFVGFRCAYEVTTSPAADAR
jgi:formylglycine-generating enzyme required for sulfatase activity